MATTKSQRVFMWTIAVVMSVGTIGAFFVPILTNNNAQKDQVDQQKVIKQMQEQQAAERAASSKPINGYSSEAFDAASVKDLKTEDLVVGEGAEATESSTLNINYFGWTSDGKIFDSTNQNGTTKPIDLSLGSVIEGWKKGLVGVRPGTVRKLTIPTDMAYGPSAAEQGRPAGPLVFIVEVKEVK